MLEEPIPGSDETEDCSYVTTLVGGDYLSVARARGAQYIRGSADFEKYRLNGMLPVAEDWHSKVCLLEVCNVTTSFTTGSSYNIAGWGLLLKWPNGHAQCRQIHSMQ